MKATTKVSAILKHPKLFIAVLSALLCLAVISATQQPNPPTRHVAVHQQHVYKPKPAPTPTPAAAPVAPPTAPSVTAAPKPVTPHAPPTAVGRGCVAPTAFEAGVNQVRAAHGLAALCTNAGLRQAALSRANYMCQTNTFGHGGFYAGQVNAYYSAPSGYTGENISVGLYPGGDGQVVQEFVNSPEHYANIINSHYTEQGAASVTCQPPYCTAIGVCKNPVPVQINVNEFGG